MLTSHFQFFHNSIKGLMFYFDILSYIVQIEVPNDHLQSCKNRKIVLQCHSIVACWHLDKGYSKEVILTLPPFFLIFSGTWIDIFMKIDRIP